MEAELVKKIYLRFLNLIIPLKKWTWNWYDDCHRIMRDHGGDVGMIVK